MCWGGSTSVRVCTWVIFENFFGRGDGAGEGYDN